MSEKKGNFLEEIIDSDLKRMKSESLKDDNPKKENTFKNSTDKSNKYIKKT